VCYDAHKLAILRAFFLEFDLTVTLRKESVITSNTNIGASMKARTALSHKNITRNDCLAAVHLDA